MAPFLGVFGGKGDERGGGVGGAGGRFGCWGGGVGESAGGRKRGGGPPPVPPKGKGGIFFFWDGFLGEQILAGESIARNVYQAMVPVKDGRAS